MDKHNFYYKQIVTEGDLNDQVSWAEAAEKNLARDIAENGVFSGLLVLPTGPATTSVQITPGVGRIQDTGSRVALALLQTVPCDQDEFGNPLYTDLLPGGGRWASIYMRAKTVESVPRVDGYGFPVWFTVSESIEFFLHRGPSGLIADKATLARPGVLTTAVLLSDIWFEAGAVAIDAADLDVTRREDYYRAEVAGVGVVAGSPKSALQQLGVVVNAGWIDLADPDLPTGADDGAHKVGLGGHATEGEWQWEGARQLDAAGDNVHEVVQKIVQDLGRDEAQGVPGSRLISAGGVTETWADASTVDAGVYDDSVGGYLAGIVKDLAGVEGGLKVGGDSSFGAPYSISAVSLQQHDEELLTSLNDHVNTSGHPVNAISHPATTSTFADGRILFPNQGNNRWNDLVNTLGEHPVGAGSSGEMVIGCGPVQAVRPFPSPVAETLVFPGNTSLAGRSSQIAYDILGRMRYNGDDRLTGTFTPEVDLGATFGSNIRRLSDVYVQQVRGTTLGVVGTGQTRLESTGAATPAQVKAEQDVILDANFSGLTGGVVRARLGNVEQLRLDTTALTPRGTAKSVGSAANRFSEAFLTTGIDVSTPGQRSRYINACGGFINNPASAQPLYAANGEYLYNGAGATFEVYAALDFLRPGDLIDTISADWTPAGAVTNVEMYLDRQPFNSVGGPGSVANMTGTFLGRHAATMSPGHTVQDGYSYYLRFWANNVANQRLYGVRIRYRSYKWPI